MSEEPRGKKAADEQASPQPITHDHLEEVSRVLTGLGQEVDFVLKVAQQSLLTTMETIQLLEAVKRRLLDTSDDSNIAPEPQPKIPRHILTDRESRVLEHICQGRTNRQIARRLGVTEKTIKNYVNGIFQKLKVHSRTEAAMMAIRWGWYQADLQVRGPATDPAVRSFSHSTEDLGGDLNPRPAP